MNKTYLIMIACGLISLIILLATSGKKENEPMWMKLQWSSLILGILIGIYGLVFLIKELFS
jgi:formate-dependent nitrite reductase membrane component NrfD